MVPRITVSPDPAGEDELVRVRVEGLTPRARATVRASMRGRPRRRWSSWSTFEADRDGAFDLRRDAPLGGSYEGVEPMGFIWSMAEERVTRIPHLIPRGRDRLVSP
jgi:hypothetical protein